MLLILLTGCASAPLGTPITTPTPMPSSNPTLSLEGAIAYVKRVVFQDRIDSTGEWSGSYESGLKRWDIERSSETGYRRLQFYLYEQSMTVERLPLPPTATPTPIPESEMIATFRNWFLMCANASVDKESTKILIDVLVKWPLRVNPDDSSVVLGPGISYDAQGKLQWEEGKWRINYVGDKPWAIDAAAKLLKDRSLCVLD